MHAKVCLGLSVVVVVFATACSSSDTGPNAAESTGGAPSGGAGAGGVGGLGAGGMSQGGVSPQGGQGGQGGGLCAPPQGPSWTDLQATATKLYETDNIMDSRVIDGGYLYFFERTKGIQRISETGGGAPELVLPVPGGDGNTAGVFYFSATHLYWGTSEATSTTLPDIHRIPRDQWTATPENIGAVVRPGLSAADGDSLLGYDMSVHELWKQDFKTGTSTALVTNVDVAGMTFDGPYVYFTDDNFGSENVSRVPVAGGAKEVISNMHVSSVGAVGVSGEDVYWSAGSTIYVTKVGDPASTKEIGRSGPGGFGFADVWELTVRGSRLYLQDDGANVAWLTLDGASCGTLLSGVIIDTTIGTSDLFISIFDFPNSIWRAPL